MENLDSSEQHGELATTVILREISELLTAIRHTGDVFMKCTATSLTVVVAILSAGVYLRTIEGKSLMPRDDLWATGAALVMTGLVMVLTIPLAFQARNNRRGIRRRLDRLRACLESLNSFVPAAAQLRVDDLRLYTLQGGNAIYSIVQWSSCVFAVIWMVLFLGAVWL